MPINWDAELLGPVMAVFGEGEAADALSWPTYTPLGGTAFQLVGAVFDEAYQQNVVIAEGGEQTTARPVLGVRDALFVAPPHQNDTVYIPRVATTFIVMDARPDGHGHTLLMLMEAA